MKKRVYEYQKAFTNQVEAYNSELMATKDQLEESRTKTRRRLRDSHVTEQIQDQADMSRELRRKRDIQVECPLPSNLIIIESGKGVICEHDSAILFFLQCPKTFDYRKNIFQNQSTENITKN